MHALSRPNLEEVTGYDATLVMLRPSIRNMTSYEYMKKRLGVLPGVTPLQFLTYTERLWWLMPSNISRVNRCRCSQHKAALEKNRFAIEKFAPTKMLGLSQVQSIRPKLRSPFWEMTDEDLSILGFFVVCRAA